MRLNDKMTSIDYVVMSLEIMYQTTSNYVKLNQVRINGVLLKAPKCTQRLTIAF